jgi:hypothetical protein
LWKACLFGPNLLLFNKLDAVNLSFDACPEKLFLLIEDEVFAISWHNFAYLMNKSTLTQVSQFLKSNLVIVSRTVTIGGFVYYGNKDLITTSFYYKF